MSSTSSGTGASKKASTTKAPSNRFSVMAAERSVQGNRNSANSSAYAALQKKLMSQGSGSGAKPGPTSSPDAVYVSPRQIKFNLPPHAWSLPITPSITDSSIYTGYATDHSTRRAIMWYYADAKTSAADELVQPPTTASTSQNTPTSTPADNYWGFQFLWNPSNFSTVLTRNSNVVPSVQDKFAYASGLFTAMEAIQFTITIDRVNDFAAFKSLPVPGSQVQYYTSGGTAGVPQNTSQMVDDLMKKGTMADIEYIYRMINGSGQTDSSGKSFVWSNALNRVTADLSFLSPTAVAIQLGPNPDSLSYVGWIESMSINHTMFTEDMIPIHSDITISFNAFSRVTLSSKGL